MILTINQALKGKATQIKGVEYLSAAAYIEPFLEKMQKYTDNFIINGILADQISIDENHQVKVEDNVYNRIWIQAVMPSDLCYDNHEEVVGLVYGLDVKQPIAKIYRGALNMACTNLCVFNPDFLQLQELQPKQKIDFKCIDSLMNKTSDIKVKLEKLYNTPIPYDEELINENLGMWIRNSLHNSYNTKLGGTVKVATSSIIKGYKYLYENDKSKYYVKDTTTNMFNIYNAMTQVLTEDTRDIMNKFEKTYLISQILGI